MADHLHKQIRAAVVSKLTGLTTTGSRVYANRLQPLPDALLPALRVYADRDQADPLTVHTPVLLERRLDLVVEGCGKAASGIDDTLDLISKEVEIALAGGITVGSATLYPLYSGMSFDDELADKPVAVKRMEFSITYTAANNAPDVLI